MAVKKKIYVRDKIYVPIDCVDISKADEHYVHYMFEDRICKSCDYYRDRPSAMCNECELGGLNEVIQTWNKKKIRGSLYASFPMGDRENLPRKIGFRYKDFKIVDIRTDVEFDFDVQMNIELRDYQEEPVATLVEEGYGVLKSPPRTGKCVTEDMIVQGNFGMLSAGELFSDMPKKTVQAVTDLRIRSRKGMENVSHKYHKHAKTLRAVTAHGYEVGGTYEHPVLVLNEKGDHEWVRLDELKEGQHLCVSLKPQEWPETNATIKDSGTWPEVITPRLSRLLGFLVANGMLAQALSKKNPYISLCSADESVLQDASRTLEELGVNYTRNDKKVPILNIYGKPFFLYLQRMGLTLCGSAGKSIPLSVRTSTKEIVLEFLSAYVSCDSHIPNNGEIELCSASKLLMRQVQVLLTSLGVPSRLKCKESYARNSNDPTVRDYYRMNISRQYDVQWLSLLKLSKAFSETTGTDTRIIPYVGGLVKKFLTKRKIRPTAFLGKEGLDVKLKVGEISRISRNTDGSISLPKLRELPDLSGLSNTVEKRLNRLKSGQYFYTPVTSVKKDGKKSVYDLTVPGSHSFIANGLVVHNTIMTLMAAVRLGYRFVIIADQKDFLDNFYETVEQFFNVEELEEEAGMPMFGFLKKKEDYYNFQIGFATYQSFISKVQGPKRVQWLNDNFGTFVVDECFVYDTPVVVDLFGRTEKIGDIVNGLTDVTSVVSFNHKTNERELKPLESITPKETEELYEVEYAGGMLECTGSHRFWCVNRNTYVRADELTKEDEIQIE